MLVPLALLSVSMLVPLALLSVSMLVPLALLSVSMLVPLALLSVSMLVPLALLSVWGSPLLQRQRVEQPGGSRIIGQRGPPEAARVVLLPSIEQLRLRLPAARLHERATRAERAAGRQV